MARFKEYDRYDGLGLAELVKKKKISPAELCEEAIRRIEALNPKLNAVIHPMFDIGRKTAKSALPGGPFRGVPFLLKDLIATYAGVPTQCGSRAFRNYIPAYRQRAGAPVQKCRFRHSGQDQHARVRADGRYRAGSIRTHAESLEHRTAPRAARAEDRPPRWHPVWCRWRPAATAADRYGSPRAIAACSGSSRRGDATPPAR